MGEFSCAVTSPFIASKISENASPRSRTDWQRLRGRMGEYFRSHHGSIETRLRRSGGGRCETGWALQADPAGMRLAGFMIYGDSAMTVHGGKTGTKFKTSHLDSGAVDWADAGRRLLAILRRRWRGRTVFVGGCGVGVGHRVHGVWVALSRVQEIRWRHTARGQEGGVSRGAWFLALIGGHVGSIPPHHAESTGARAGRNPRRSHRGVISTSSRVARSAKPPVRAPTPNLPPTGKAKPGIARLVKIGAPLKETLRPRFTS